MWCKMRFMCNAIWNGTHIMSYHIFEVDWISSMMCCVCVMRCKMVLISRVFVCNVIGNRQSHDLIFFLDKELITGNNPCIFLGQASLPRRCLGRPRTPDYNGSHPSTKTGWLRGSMRQAALATLPCILYSRVRPTSSRWPWCRFWLTTHETLFLVYHVGIYVEFSSMIIALDP